MKNKLKFLNGNFILKAIKQIGVFILLCIVFTGVMQLAGLEKKVEVSYTEYNKLEQKYTEVKGEYDNISTEQKDKLDKLNNEKESLSNENEQLNKTINDLNSKL
ncbi:MAG: hypothetical protein ACRCVJ_13395 [Clostridium sp.]|uniref:hypothetical protein n=1 Tax=Clostridium sp. TaxID=1506 RepID=UPI003F343C8C